MTHNPVVTIDGPAASGKTSVSRELAQRLGWNWVSTGAFYRGLAFVALHDKVNLTDEKAVKELAESKRWNVSMDADQTRVFLEGRDVTNDLIKEEIGNAASIISQLKSVRQALLDGQRKCSTVGSGLVAEGRDCGTVVFPKAEVKVYVTARSEDRAERRARELGRSAEELEKEQKIRDLQDTSRKTAPLAVPSDAFVVDTTHLSLDQVVEKIEKHVRLTLSAQI